MTDMTPEEKAAAADLARRAIAAARRREQTQSHTECGDCRRLIDPDGPCPYCGSSRKIAVFPA